MPFNVLLLPLLGGYVFITRWNRTKFGTRDHSGYRLIMTAAIWGVVFLAVAWIVANVAESCLPGYARWWTNHVPFEYSGTTALAFFLGVTLWAPLNLVFGEEAESARAIQHRGDSLEMLFNRSATRTELISVTLNSRKVYVAFVTTLQDPKFDRKYVTLLPIVSGYRDPETLRLEITEDYTSVYEVVGPDASHPMEMASEFELVLPVAAILSANLFDPEAYLEFLSREEQGREAE